SDTRQPTSPVASSAFDPSKNTTSSSSGPTSRSGRASSPNRAGSVHDSSDATTWLYQKRRDRLGGLRVSRIDATTRSTSSHTESPRIDRTTSGAASAVSGASGGASRES